METPSGSEKGNSMDDLWELRYRHVSRRRVERILKLYFWLGLTVATLAAVYFALLTLDLQLSTRQQTALLVAGTGLVLSIVSRALLVIRREQFEERLTSIQVMENSSEFLDSWLTFERNAKELLRRRGKEFDKYSIRRLIEHLQSERLIDEEDARSLEKALQTRNMIVHGEETIPVQILREYDRKVGEINSKLDQE